MKLAWILLFGGVALAYLVLRYVSHNPDLAARWKGGDRLRTWYFLTVYAFPVIWLLVWMGPKLVEEPGSAPAPATWLSELRAADMEAGGEQRRVEHRLAMQVGAALEDGLGAEHFRVIVHAGVKEQDLQNLVLHLVVDENRLSFDPVTETYAISPRPQDDIDASLELAKRAAGFDAVRGDLASLIALPFDHARMVTEDIAHRRMVESEASTHKVKVGAKILSIISALVTLTWVIRCAERDMGLREGGGGCRCC